MSNIKVRFPNESTYTEVPNFDWSEFKKEKEYDTCMFGYYKNMYICIEHNKIKTMEKLEIPSTIDTIGCATEITQPPVPKIKWIE